MPASILSGDPTNRNSHLPEDLRAVDEVVTLGRGRVREHVSTGRATIGR